MSETPTRDAAVPSEDHGRAAAEPQPPGPALLSVSSRILYALGGVLLPLLLVALVLEMGLLKNHVGLGESGNPLCYMAILVRPVSSWQFLPFAAYSMSCLLIVVIRGVCPRQLLLRFGIYTGVIWALQYAILYLFVLRGDEVMGPSNLILLAYAVLTVPPLTYCAYLFIRAAIGRIRRLSRPPAAAVVAPRFQPSLASVGGFAAGLYAAVVGIPLVGTTTFLIILAVPPIIYGPYLLIRATAQQKQREAHPAAAIPAPPAGPWLAAVVGFVAGVLYGMAGIWLLNRMAFLIVLAIPPTAFYGWLALRTRRKLPEVSADPTLAGAPAHPLSSIAVPAVFAAGILAPFAVDWIMLAFGIFCFAIPPLAAYIFLAVRAIRKKRQPPTAPAPAADAEKPPRSLMLPTVFVFGMLTAVLGIALTDIDQVMQVLAVPAIGLIGAFAFPAPIWACTAYGSLAWWLWTHREAGIGPVAPKAAGWIAWLGAYALAWRLAILRAPAIDAMMAHGHPDTCYVCTAAAKGHPGLVKSQPLVRSDAAVLWVNDQMRYLKLAELTFMQIAPRLHRACRIGYNVVGPRLAAMLVHPLLADLAYLALKPPEWLARVLMRLLVPDLDSVVRGVFGTSRRG